VLSNACSLRSFDYRPLFVSDLSFLAGAGFCFSSVLTLSFSVILHFDVQTAIYHWRKILYLPDLDIDPLDLPRNDSPILPRLRSSFPSIDDLLV